VRTDRKWLADTTGRLKRAERECRVSREFWKRRRTRTTLERSTATDVASVPEHRIVNGLAELVCGYPFVNKKPINKVVRLHEALATIQGQGLFSQ
jgi:hypothetical protein